MTEKLSYIACDCGLAGNGLLSPHIASQNDKTDQRFDSEVYHLAMSLCPVRFEFNCEDTFNSSHTFTIFLEVSFPSTLRLFRRTPNTQFCLRVRCCRSLKSMKLLAKQHRAPSVVFVVRPRSKSCKHLYLLFKIQSIHFFRCGSTLFAAKQNAKHRRGEICTGSRTG